MQQGKPAEAATQLEHVTTLQPDNEDAWSLLGSVWKDLDDSRATQAFTRATALRPDQASLHVQLAAILAQQGKPQEAAAERKIAATLSRAAVGKQREAFALRAAKPCSPKANSPKPKPSSAPP